MYHHSAKSRQGQDWVGRGQPSALAHATSLYCVTLHQTLVMYREIL
jgi:hypothetical protein